MSMHSACDDRGLSHNNTKCEKDYLTISMKTSLYVIIGSALRLYKLIDYRVR